jgi:hypothetical protein
MTYADRVASAVVARLAAGRSRRPPPARDSASFVASAVANRLNAVGKPRPQRRPQAPGLAAAIASAVGQHLAGVGTRAKPEVSLAPKSLHGARLAGRVAGQVASRVPETRGDFVSSFSAIDVAKVAASVVEKLGARKSKGIDHVDVIASQIASRLATPRIQGTAAGAADFQNRIIGAVAEALETNRKKALEASATAAPAGENKGEARAEKATVKRKR